MDEAFTWEADDYDQLHHNDDYQGDDLHTWHEEHLFDSFEDANHAAEAYYEDLDLARSGGDWELIGVHVYYDDYNDAWVVDMEMVVEY